MFLYLILSAVLIIADQLVKLWIVNNFSLHDGMQFINGIVSLLYVRNTGAAWGMFEGKMFFFLRNYCSSCWNTFILNV